MGRPRRSRQRRRTRPRPPAASPVNGPAPEIAPSPTPTPTNLLADPDAYLSLDDFATHVPKPAEPRRRYLDADEIARLMAACCASTNPHLEAIVTIAINCGMRRSEICGLTWSRIDLSTGKITLYETKNAKPRSVPINTDVYRTLVEIEPDATRRVGPVFVGLGKSKGGYGSVRTAFETAVRRAKLADFRFHDLRHTCASHLVMRGAALKDVQEILGHKTFSMTLRYSHLSPEHLRAAVDRLDGLTAPAAAPSVSARASADPDRIDVRAI